MEKLEIENFAGIRSMTLEFKDINILIGPQGAGKSITVKLLYFFKGFFDEIINGAATKKDFGLIVAEKLNRFIKLFPRKYWPQNDFTIKYYSSRTWQQIAKRNENLLFDFSDHWKEIYPVAYKEYNSQAVQANGTRPTRGNLFEKVYKLVELILGKDISYEQIFIPAQRGFFATLANNIFYLIKNRASLDPFLVDFGEVYEEMRDLYFNDQDALSSHDLDNLIAPILKSKVIQENNIEFLLHTDGRKIGLADASSGQQEALPIMLILKSLAYYMSLLPENGLTLYIEEPEAHLFPSAQKNITQMLARVFNQLYPRLQIFITTHSPYLLASFNNLLEAGHLAATKPEIVPTLANIVPQAEQLAPGTVCAYHLAQGQAKSLIDEETGLITASSLDEVSAQIAIEFGKLLDLEP
jgi:hypothetical protein